MLLGPPAGLPERLDEAVARSRTARESGAEGPGEMESFLATLKGELPVSVFDGQAAAGAGESHTGGDTSASRRSAPEAQA